MTNNDSNPQPNLTCPFCKNGTYIRHERNFFEKLGVPTVDGMIGPVYRPELYICNNCNNIQIFATKKPDRNE